MPQRLQGSKNLIEVYGGAAARRTRRPAGAIARTVSLWMLSGGLVSGWMSCSAMAGSAPPPARPRQVVCDGGSGRFQATFETGVRVTVDAVPRAGFASRACQAVLSRGGGRVVAVPSADRIDLDAMGADLGLGVPVAAFTVRTAKQDWQSRYAIWSLEKNPRRLRTLTGGGSYRAVDADFNRYVAIWTTDARGAEGFDGFTRADYEFPPMVVLRFERGKLVDVSAWYRAQYDRQIAAVRQELSPPALAAFQQSDGRLRLGSTPPQDLARLRKTKVRVLEIVWSYLYSGRPAQAWKELDAAWPTADRARVQAAILKARANGIEAQVAGVASPRLPPKWHQASFVYQYLRVPSASTAN